MAGTITPTKPAKAGERSLLLPSGGAGWEVWAVGDGARTRFVRACDMPAEARVSPQSILALPLRQLFAVPLWLATTDPALMRGMIFLQLERRGLASGRAPREMVFDYRVIATAGNKTLVLAVALPSALPAQFCIDLRAYEPSARLLPLPPDSFTLWRENGRLALAVTRGAELAYFHALGDGHFTAPVLRELQCIKLQLESENTIERANGATLWGDFDPGEISALGETLGLRAAAAPRPAPVLPREWMDLTPGTVRQTQQAAQTRGRRFSLAALAAAAYLLFLLALVAVVTLLYVEDRRLASGLAANSGEVSGIEAAAARWNALAPAIDREYYPVETLLRCSSLLPPEGVRFTSFSTETGKIHIKGEASSTKAAIDFQEALKHDGDLGDYKFDTPLPVTPPNANTIFIIEGVRYGTPAH